MFLFPVLEAMQQADPSSPIWRRMQQDRTYFPPWSELPVLAATRIALDLRISS